MSNSDPWKDVPKPKLRTVFDIEDWQEKVVKAIMDEIEPPVRVDNIPFRNWTEAKDVQFTVDNDIPLKTNEVAINNNGVKVMRWDNPAVFNSRLSSATTQDLDDFPTPPWACRALLEGLDRTGTFDNAGNQIALEPACGRGHMAMALGEYFRHVGAFDITDYGRGYDVRDFLSVTPLAYDWLVTNPPFKLAESFIHRGLIEARQGVAIFVRTNFLEGQGRYANLYSAHRPSLILQFAERVILHEHELRDPDKLYQLPDGTWKKPSTATSYCWLVWLTQRKALQTNFDWIEPCRLSLTKPFDYVSLPGI